MDTLHFRSRKAKLRIGLALSLAGFLLALGLELSGLLETYSLKTLDLLFRSASLHPACPDVVIVTVAQPDLDFFNERGMTWPWPRQLYAPMIEFCRRAGARAVIMDILFTESSSYGQEDDERLAEAMAASGSVILPFFLSRQEKGPGLTDHALLKKAGLIIAGPSPELPAYRSALSPIPPLLAQAKGLGNVECRPDRDGLYRRVPLVVPYKDHWLPLLSFAAFLPHETRTGLRFEPGVLVHGEHKLPLDKNGQFLLKFRGPSGTHRTFSAANVIQSEYLARQSLPPVYPPEDFAGKYVFVGLTAPGLLDLKASPVDAVYPGVEIHATLLDNLLEGDFLRSASQWVCWVWAILLAGAAAVTVLFSPGLSVTLGIPALLFGVHGIGVILAFKASWWFEPLVPALSLIASFLLAASYSYATEGRQRQAIRRMFVQYMSETVIDHLMHHPEKLRLGGERRKVTLFFSDLAGFTAMSEALAPEAVVDLLNQYLSRMTEIILEEAGTLDKFEGDAIMAFWGAPLDQEDQALRACRAGLRQQAALAEINHSFGRLGLPILKVRMGLHSGDAIVGNLGSQRRFDYTVIGDTVNLASRLEGLNKFYGTGILASEATAEQCGGWIEFQELDEVVVKGRERPIRVLEVLALKGELTPRQVAGRDEFANGLALYRQRRFSEAAERFTAVLAHLPNDGPSKLFLDRCRRLQGDPPAPEWDAVFRPDQK